MTFIQDLLALLAPRICLLCKQPLEEAEEHLCTHCFDALPKYPIRGEGLLFLSHRHWGKVNSERAASIFPYVKDSRVQALIWAIKYERYTALGKMLSRYGATKLMEVGFFDGMDAIIPLPLHPKKEKKRGHNQCMIIAQGIADVTGLEVISPLIRQTNDKSQTTHKRWDERWDNLSAPFVNTAPEQTDGKHILLVDDVFTSGATIAQAVKAIHANSPSAQCSIFTLAAVRG